LFPPFCEWIGILLSKIAVPVCDKMKNLGLGAIKR
jgi:hypothetical protein